MDSPKTSASRTGPDLAELIGTIPYRMAFAGGWIDQPFVSILNSMPPGSMVVVGVEPEFRFMDRCGMATSTREVARRLWNGVLPDGEPAQLMRELYNAENAGKPEPSGSQDMAGLLYPGVSRLDYDASFEGGYFPAHIETNVDPDVAHWLERVIHVLPIAQRPEVYSPLGEKHIDPDWVKRLGQSGKACFDAIVAKDLRGLGASMNECMVCWEELMPHIVRHPNITVDIKGILAYYQQHSAGAMYSGCGGGYLYVVADAPVAGEIRVKVRLPAAT
jgi:hypothetical protein